jgi:ribonuclease E
MFSPTVQLRSGGYIVINQTEALVSIDVNSGRSTREHHIEDTALKTNLEAAEEVARQLRLRDLAGLIVIDFIDMDEKRNNRSVERKLSDCLRQGARIQVGRISHFGLLEMSRQRIRASVLESSTEPCAQCGGTGHVRSVSSVALQLLRGIEDPDEGRDPQSECAYPHRRRAYVLNHKRGHLRDLENSFKVSLAVVADPTVSGQQSFIIDRGEQVHTLEAAKALLAAQAQRLRRKTTMSKTMTMFSTLKQDRKSRPRKPRLSATSSPRPRTQTAKATDSAAGGAGGGVAAAAARAREGGPRDETEVVQAAMAEPTEGGVADDGFAEDEESDEQPAFAGADQGRMASGGRAVDAAAVAAGAADVRALQAPSPTNLRRPPHEAATAVADFDGGSEPAPSIVQQPRPVVPTFQPETVRSSRGSARRSACGRRGGNRCRREGRARVRPCARR